MAKRLRRLLVVSWALPPLLTPRSLQVGRLLHALARIGWEIDVLSVDPKSIHTTQLDRSLNLRYTNLLNVYRFPEPITNLLKVILAKFFPSLLPLLGTSDFWVKRAITAGTQLFQKRKYQALLSFGQPWASHIVGLNLKKLSDLPWLAHFSDPWVNNPYLKQLSANQQAKMLKMERAVFESADKLIFTNKPAASVEMQKYPKSWNKKVEIIPHAFDRAMFPGHVTCTQKSRRMRFVYTGNLYGLRNPRNVILALEELRQTGQVKLEIAGVIKGEEIYRQLAEKIGVREIVSFLGQMTYKSSLDLAAQADVLLLIDAPSENSLFLPSKLIDYLMFEKPILGITPENGAAADLLHELAYPVADPDNVGEITAAMRKLIKQWQSHELKTSKKHRKVAKRYEIGGVAGEFEELINSVRRLQRN